MRTDRCRAWVLAVVGAAVFACASGAMAQAYDAPPAKAPFKQGVVNQNARQIKSWELGLRRFYGRQQSATARAKDRQALGKLYSDPLAKKDPLAKLNRDPLLKHGFGRHVRMPKAPVDTAPSALTFDPGVARLDGNSDGAVSLDEYVRGRDRTITRGGAVSGRDQQVYRERLRSQFGFADQNRDGMVTPDELQGVSGSRF